MFWKGITWLGKRLAQNHNGDQLASFSLKNRQLQQEELIYKQNPFILKRFFLKWEKAQ